MMKTITFWVIIFGVTIGLGIGKWYSANTEKTYSLNADGSVTYTKIFTPTSKVLREIVIPQNLLLKYDPTFAEATYEQVSRCLITDAWESVFCEAVQFILKFILRLTILSGILFLMVHVVLENIKSLTNASEKFLDLGFKLLGYSLFLWLTLPAFGSQIPPYLLDFAQEAFKPLIVF